MQTTGCTFNTNSGRQDRRQDSDTARSRYRGFRKCCLNVSHKEGKENRQKGKNVECKANLNFRLENALAKSKQVKETRQNFPLWVKIDFQHGHALNRADYLRYLSVSNDTKDLFIDMFDSGMSAGAAHEEMRIKI